VDADCPCARVAPGFVTASSARGICRREHADAEPAGSVADGRAGGVRGGSLGGAERCQRLVTNGHHHSEDALEKNQYHVSMRSLLVAAAALAVPLHAEQALASGFNIGCVLCGVWLPVGPNVGIASRDDPVGFLLGGEVSLVDLRDARETHGAYWGAYADGLHDSGSHSWRLSIGPERVFCPYVGVDAGPVLSLGKQGTDVGARLRYFVAFPIAPYFGVDLIATGKERFIVETGLLLKFPIPVGGQK
jgi:hypothetical protein